VYMLMNTPVANESFEHRSWSSSNPPKKILVIRFHAFGDVIITLPYLQTLKNAFPQIEIHYLTRKECSDIVNHAPMFTKVYALDDRRNGKLLFAKVVVLLPILFSERYDIVLDLQRNAVSRMVRRFLLPKSFSEFDRFSFMSAGERVRQTIDAVHIALIPDVLPDIEINYAVLNRNRWKSNGYSEGKKYIILNPAGSSITKNWPIEYYEQFALLWKKSIDDQTQFLIIGTERILQKAQYLKQQLGSNVINLAGMTTVTEAFMLLQKAQFVLSEDSGLMHMAWISKIPLLALFGSTPSVWAKPLGDTSLCLDSSDLECGNCNQTQCKFGNVHCLTRYTPEYVLEKAKQLLHKMNQQARSNNTV
jgi:heptosyltransferase-2